jgi:hypothetical protein
MFESILILISQRIVLQGLFVIVLSIFVIHSIHIVLTKLINFILNAHLGGFLLLLLSLHLMKSCQFHLTNFVLSLSLIEPGFITPSVAGIVIHSFVFNSLLSFLVISELCYFIRLIEFLIFEPILHVVNS